MVRPLRGVARFCGAVWLSAAVALSGCASKPPKPPPHTWRAQGFNFEHVPITGLPAVPTVLAGEQPIRLINFGVQEQDELRDQAVGSGAGSGAAQAVGGVLKMSVVGVAMCALLPPLCVGVVGVSAVAGGVGASARFGERVSPEQGEQFASFFKKYPASSLLQQQLTKSIPAPDSRENKPRLIVTMESVGLMTNEYGVTFVVRADVRGFPAPNVEWKPSVHFVSLPSRPAAEWLAEDGKLIRSDCDAAIVALSSNIRSAYLSVDTPSSP